jgi:hypothetical protein
MSQNIFTTDYVSDDYFCEYSDNARDCKELESVLVQLATRVYPENKILLQKLLI